MLILNDRKEGRGRRAAHPQGTPKHIGVTLGVIRKLLENVYVSYCAVMASIASPFPQKALSQAGPSFFCGGGFSALRAGFCCQLRMFFLGLRPGLFFEMFLFALRALFSLGLRPGPFLKTFLFALRALFFPGPAARAFSPFGHFASGGELFARPKSSSKTAPSGGPAGPWPHLRPSWGFPLPRPSARVAGHCENSERVSSAV